MQEALSDTVEYHLLVLRNSARCGYTDITLISGIVQNISKSVLGGAFYTKSQISCQRGIPVQIHWIYQVVILQADLEKKCGCSPACGRPNSSSSSSSSRRRRRRRRSSSPISLLSVDELFNFLWQWLCFEKYTLWAAKVETWWEIKQFWWYFFLWLTFLYPQKCDMWMDVWDKI